MRIALMLRGHARTWRWTIPSMIQALSACSDRMDAYICLWRTHTFGQRELRELAGMLPTVHAELTEPGHWDADTACDGYSAPSWQGERLAKVRRRRQSHGVGYDMIIDTRPDIYIETHAPWLTGPRYGQVLSTMCKDPWDGSDLPGMEDHLLIMDAPTHDVWCQRHHQRYDIAYNHCILHRYCRDKGLTVGTIPWMRTNFVRPNWHLRQEIAVNHADLKLTLDEWIDMDQISRLHHCEAAGIDPMEYSAPFHVGNLAFTYM